MQSNLPRAFAQERPPRPGLAQAPETGPRRAQAGRSPGRSSHAPRRSSGDPQMIHIPKGPASTAQSAIRMTGRHAPRLTG